MKNKKILLMSLVMLIVSGCFASKDKEINDDTIGYDVDAVIDDHKTATAIDWVGTYRGVMPCADCAGIETTLILSNNGNYRLEQDYRGKDQVTDQVGKYEWRNKGPEMILRDSDGTSRTIFVGEGYVEFYYANGEKPTGMMAKQYRLLKD